MNTEPDSTPRRGRNRTALVVGLIVGGVVMFFGLVTGVVFWVRAAAEDQIRRNNAKIVSLCLENYDSANGKLPGPSIDAETRNPRRQLNLFAMAEEDPVTPPANPSDRMSWRALILPYMERDDVSRLLDFNKPWNDPANLPATSRPIRAFGDPLDPVDANTRFRVFFNNGALWDSDPKRRVPLDKIPDGAANTILVVESTVQVPWAQFNEHPYDPAGPLPELGRAGRNTFLACMADGSVRVVKKTVRPNTLRSAITREGGDEVGPDW